MSMQKHKWYIVFENPHTGYHPDWRNAYYYTFQRCVTLKHCDFYVSDLKIAAEVKSKLITNHFMRLKNTVANK